MNNNFLTIQEAAEILGVSTKTLRRWDKAGILVPNRTVGNQRRYEREKIEIFTRSKTLLYSPSPSLQIQEPLKTERFGRFLPKANPIQIALVASGACVFLILLGIHIGANVLIKSDIGKANLDSTSKGAIKQTDQSGENIGKGLVLGEATAKNEILLKINASSSFNNSAAFLEGIMAAKIATLSGGIITDDQDIDAGTGTLTASNVLYGTTAGTGISVGTGQRPTITNTDLGSSQNIFKTIKVGSDSFSTSSNTDTIEFSAGTGISLSTDKSNKKVTITGSATSGWTDDGTAVRLTTSTDSVGIGLTGPSSKLDVLATSEQLRLLYDSTNYTSFTISSGGDLTLNPTGGDIILGDADVLNLGGSGSDTAYNIIGDSSSGASSIVDSDDDLYIEGNIEIDGTVRFNNVSYTFPSADGSNTYIMQTNGSGTLSWIDPGTLPSTNFWDRDSGAIYPKIATVLDFFVGGTSTASAKFAVLNVNSGTPTASVSAGVAGGAYLSATGTLATTAMQALTLGGSTTGNITIDSGTSSITLSDDTTISGDLAVNGATSADITSTTTTGTLFNSTVTTLSLGGAATTLNLGATDSVTRTINLGTGTGADTINIGTGATTANTINVGTGAVANTIAIGSSSTTSLSLTDDNWSITAAGLITTADDIALNGGDLTTSATTFNLVNAAATTVNFAGAATTLSIGASTGTTTVNNALTVTGAGTFNNTFTNTNGTTSNSLINLTSSGDFVLQDAGVTVVTFTDAGILTLAAQAPTEGSNFIALTNTAGSGTSYDMLDISLTSASDDAGADTQRAAALTITGPTDTEDTTVGLAIVGGTASGGTEVAIDIPAITAGAGTETAIRISSGWDTVLDSNALDISGAGVVTGATGITSSGTITLSGLTASRFVVTDASSNLAATAASSVLLDTLSDETGTGVAVFGTSPTITTSLITDSTTFALVNTTATTVNFAGAATTLNMGTTDSVTRTINLGTGTGADTINIGTGATTADAITLGNTGVATTIDINSGAATVNAIDIAIDSITTANSLALTSNALTTGTALAISSTATSFNGELLTLSKTGASGSTAFTSDIANITYSQTFNGGVGLDSTGNALDISRAITLDNTGNTHTISGALLTISDTGTQTAGTLTWTGDTMRIAQNYANTNAAALNITTASTDTGTSNFALRVNDDGTFTDSTAFVVDEAGSVGIGTASPTTADLTVGDTAANPGKIRVMTSGSTTAQIVLGSEDVGSGPSISGGNRLIITSSTSFDPGGGNLALNGDGGILFGIVGSEVMRVVSGAVGIGDTGPDARLDILSSAAASNGIIIAQTNAGDYDPFVDFQLTDGTTLFRLGVDDSDNDTFKIGTSALETSTMLTLDSRTTTSGVSAITLAGIAPTIASAATAEYTTLTITPPTITLTGTTAVTSQMDSIVINQPTITGNTATVTVNDAATMTIAGPVIESTNVNLSETYGLKINAGTDTNATDAYGLYVIPSNSDTANNYGIVIENIGQVELYFKDGEGTTANVLADSSLLFDIDENANETNAQFSIRNSGDTTIFIFYENGDFIQSSGTTTASKTSGFLFLNTTAGTPTGSVTNPTGLAGMTYDITNNKLCMRDGSSWLCSGALSDIAEWVPAPGVEGGDLIAVTDQPNPVDDPTAPTIFAKTTTAYDPKLVGVISQYAEEVGSAQGYKLSEDYHAMTLVGRVPVKVSLENGAILAGDYLTSSSTPGVAMKATKAGHVIGIALEPFEEGDGDGKILVFINPHWQDPSIYIAADGSLVSQSLADSSTETASTSAQTTFDLAKDPTFQDIQNKVDLLESKIDFLSLMVNNASTSAPLKEIGEVGGIGKTMEIETATVSGSLMVLGKATVSDLGITGNISAGVLAINGLEGKIDTLAGDLKLQSEGLGGIDILNGKITIDTKGNLRSEGTIAAKSIEAEQFGVKGSKSIGTGVIESGKTSVEVVAESATSSSKIFITPTTVTNKQLAVAAKLDGKFRVEILEADAKPITFDWWVVGAN